MNELQIITTFEEDITTIKDCTTKVFLVTGKILQGIQDNKKYKEAGYKTFAEAVKIELGLDKRNAYYLIEAANVYENVNNCSQNLPTSESQLRPMAKLPAPEQIEVWQEVAKDKVPTAKEVQAAVDKRLGKIKVKKVNVPVIDTTKYITIEEHNKVVNDIIIASLKDGENFQKIISELKERLAKYEPVVETVKTNTISREAAYTFIKSFGNQIQCTAVQSSVLPDEKLFKLFAKVREEFQHNNPPQTWTSEITNAEKIG